MHIALIDIQASGINYLSAYAQSVQQILVQFFVEKKTLLNTTKSNNAVTHRHLGCVTKQRADGAILIAIFWTIRYHCP